MASLLPSVPIGKSISKPSVSPATTGGLKFCSKVKFRLKSAERGGANQVLQLKDGCKTLFALPTPSPLASCVHALFPDGWVHKFLVICYTILMKPTNRKNGRGSLKVRRLPVTLTSDMRRVITRFFDPGGEVRIRNIIERINDLSGGAG